MLGAFNWTFENINVESQSIDICFTQDRTLLAKISCDFINNKITEHGDISKVMSFQGNQKKKDFINGLAEQARIVLQNSGKDEE